MIAWKELVRDEREWQAQDEPELYDMVISVFDHLYQDPQPEQMFSYQLREVDERRVHVLAEEGNSSKPVEFAHANLVGEIHQDPSRWMILQEGGEDRETDPSIHPTLYYFQELAHLYSLPYEPAMADIFSPSTQQYLTEQGVDKETIHLYLLTMGILDVAPSSEAELTVFAKFAADLLKKPEEYIWDFLSKGPQPVEERERVDREWASYSHQHFYQMLEAHPDRDHILVSVIHTHMDVFR